MFKIQSIHRFSTLSPVLTQFINPTPAYSPYWKTYGIEQDVAKPQILNDLFKSIVSLMTMPLDQNKLLYKQYFKDLQNYKEKNIAHNIEFEMNIELGLREKILQIREELQLNGLSLKFPQDYQFQQSQWIQDGSLEIYGLSPYRHMNHYMSQYEYFQVEGIMNFNKKEINSPQSGKNQAIDELQKPIIESIKSEATQTFSLREFNKKYVSKYAIMMFGNPTPEEHLFDKIARLKKGVEKGTKQQHILVRDYKLDCTARFMLDGAPPNLKELEKPLQVSIRTESWIDANDSESTYKQKKQVITDFNWILKGNPQVFVKRYDLI